MATHCPAPIGFARTRPISTVGNDNATVPRRRPSPPPVAERFCRTRATPDVGGRSQTSCGLHRTCHQIVLQSQVAGLMIVLGLGLGLTSAPATEAIMGAVPREKAGQGSAVNDALEKSEAPSA